MCILRSHFDSQWVGGRQYWTLGHFSESGNSGGNGKFRRQLLHAKGWNKGRDSQFQWWEPVTNGRHHQWLESQRTTAWGGASIRKPSQKDFFPCVWKISKYLYLLNVLVGFYLMNSHTFTFFRASIFEVPKNSRLFMKLCKDSICLILKSRALMEN